MGVTLNSKADKPVALISGSNWNLDCWFLWREENRRTRRKRLGARTRTNNKLNPHVTPGPGIEVGPPRSHHCIIPASRQLTIMFWPFDGWPLLTPLTSSKQSTQDKFTVNALHAWTLGDVRFRYSREWFVNEFDWHAFATRLKDYVSNNRSVEDFANIRWRTTTFAQRSLADLAFIASKFRLLQEYHLLLIRAHYLHKKMAASCCGGQSVARLWTAPFVTLVCLVLREISDTLLHYCTDQQSLPWQTQVMVYRAGKIHQGNL